MSKFEEYQGKYKHVTMERRDGIIQMTLHSEGGPLKWGGPPHEELSYAFYDVARDHGNRCVIITGTGEAFCAEVDLGGGRGAPVGKTASGEPAPAPHAGVRTTTWDHIYNDAKYLLMNHLHIEVPMIAAVNGPALIHAELAVLCDIVIASENAAFQDAPHFPNGIVPGDGVHVVWPLVLGPNRGRYFLLTGQKLSAREALELGVVSEVVPRERSGGARLGTRAANRRQTAAHRALCARRDNSAAQAPDARRPWLWARARRAGRGDVMARSQRPGTLI